ncbi:hypothetical protein, conserved [Eimeria necatrix]|uniref:Uncharacterized protein n=1 Tax=Eimeria necatrix TaxID=51315 RepID=U6MN02_9EIME|nr:hypothetical protein, conserved [Eimeria necatrix]CDJ64463.1 hypothetical protein, conserved [Eimeria necatrix]
MALSRIVMQLQWRPFFIAVASFLLHLTKAMGDDWEEKVGGGVYPAVEYVANEPNKTYNIPVELNDEPLVLIQWSTDVSRRRREFQYSFPPGILVVALLMAAGAFFLWSTKRGALTHRGEVPSDANATDKAVSPEYIEDCLSGYHGVGQDSCSVLQSVLRKLSADLQSAMRETHEKESLARALLDKENTEVTINMANTISSLSEASAKLAAPAKAITNTLEILQRPLSDSQATFHLNGALEELQAAIQNPLYDMKLKDELNLALEYLKRVGEEPASETSLPQMKNLLGEQQDFAEQSNRTTLEMVVQCTAWLEALFRQQHTLLEAVPIVSKAVENVRTQYDFLL